MNNTRDQDIPLGVFEKIYARFWGKIHRKVNLDDHREVLLVEHKSKLLIVIKETHPGNASYYNYSVTEFRNLQICVDDMLSEFPLGEINR